MWVGLLGRIATLGRLGRVPPLRVRLLGGVSPLRWVGLLLLLLYGWVGLLLRRLLHGRVGRVVGLRVWAQSCSSRAGRPPLLAVVERQQLVQGDAAIPIQVLAAQEQQPGVR